MLFVLGFVFVLLVLAGLVTLAIWIIRKLLRFRMSPPHSTDQTPNAEHLSADFAQQPRSKSVGSLFDSLTVRSLIIGLLALAMLIPLALVGGVVGERGYRYQSVLSDIASTWGEQQVVLAPVLVVPFTELVQIQETVTDDDGKSRVISKQVQYNQTAQFLPDSLDIDVRMKDEFKQRGIFESLVYVADVTVNAEFGDFAVASLSENVNVIHWDKAWVSVGLSDTRAINNVGSFEWDAKARELSPGTKLGYLPSGFHALIGSLKESSTPDSERHTLSMKMNINGSSSFRFAPFGERTQVTMQSTWPHPSFQGDALPDEHEITSEGFTARWDIPHLARNYPQRWATGHTDQNLFEFTAGVSMFEPVSLYSQVNRAVKYGILFIGLTFLTLFIFEMTINRRLHIVQYALIGIALSLFFLVLLSLSEHIPFIRAYMAAAALTISMISCYTWVVLRSFVRAVAVLIMLVALYAVLYSLLQLEDYALMMGTALLVFVVMVLMFVTRNIQNGSDDEALPEQ